ncbi:MAG: phosphoglyceromutase [Bacteroidetes bacterium]|nr:phosphoglyceromutase [Bacteroidota bacterium]
MKSILSFITLAVMLPGLYEPVSLPTPPDNKLPVAENLFIITTDGFRWQELFTGADSTLINSEKYTPDTSTLKLLYWAESPEERRKKLMPFFWNVIAAKGQIFGNRTYGNNVNVANSYAISYPGYNEIFTGNTDITIASNRKKNNPNINVLEYLNGKEAFHGKVAAFTSWDVFPYILNTDRNALPINSGYAELKEPETETEYLINKVQSDVVQEKNATRQDALTFLTAKEYINKNKPRVVYLGLGETDEFAHQGRYDLYLNKATEVDKMIADLWHWVQTTPGYKDHTTFLITTDHGRGSKSSRWTSHGELINGSSQTWFAVIGPGVKGIGEIREKGQYYQSQLAETIAGILGEKFILQNAAPPVSLR